MIEDLTHLNIEHFKGIHTGKPIALLGNGPSLNRFDVAAIKFPIMGMNRSWKKVAAPYHAIMSSKHYFDEIENGKWGPGIVFTLDVYTNRAKSLDHIYEAWPDTCLIQQQNAVRRPRTGQPTFRRAVFAFALERGIIVNLTGIFALQIAVYMECSPIYLLGYDLGDDEAHFCDDMIAGRSHLVQLFVEARDVLKRKPEIKIFNCNPISRIKCFPYKSFETVLETEEPYDARESWRSLPLMVTNNAGNARAAL